MSCFSSISLYHQLEISILSLRLHHQSKASTLLINGVYLFPLISICHAEKLKTAALPYVLDAKRATKKTPKVILGAGLGLSETHVYIGKIFMRMLSNPLQRNP